MTKKKPPPDNPEQSRRFIEEAKRMQAAGELDLTVAGEKFARAFKKVVPEKKKKTPA